MQAIIYALGKLFIIPQVFNGGIQFFCFRVLGNVDIIRFWAKFCGARCFYIIKIKSLRLFFQSPLLRHIQNRVNVLCNLGDYKTGEQVPKIIITRNHKTLVLFMSFFLSAENQLFLLDITEHLCYHKITATGVMVLFIILGLLVSSEKRPRRTWPCDVMSANLQ